MIDGEEGGFGPLPTRSGRLASQQPRELQRFIDILRDEGVTSYLEIGARHGDTFYEVMRALPAGSKGIAIDLPNGPWGGNSRNDLIAACDELRQMGYEISMILGDSQLIELHEDYDAVLIDADHRYEYVKADWEEYGNCRIVAFHDIAGEGISLRDMDIGVPRLWREIKGDFRHEEIIDPSDDRPMGIGVLFRW